jgi:hypothetical protein
MKRSFLVLTALSLVIASCGGSTESTTTTEAIETTTTVAASSSSSTPDATTSTSGPEAAGGGDSCLYGDWVLDNQVFIDEVFNSFGGDENGFGDVSPAGGTNTISFDADGTLSTAQEDWGFLIERIEGSFKILISDMRTGTWATNGDVLSISLNDGQPPEITALLVVDGQEVALPEAPFDVPAEALSASSQYSCDSDSLSVSNDDFSSSFNRP